jgi:hypothetical protein
MASDYLAQEFQELGRSLAMSADSTGVQKPFELSAQMRPLRLALRDTLVRGWLTAIGGEGQGPAPLGAAEYRAVYELLALAIVMTWDVIA